MMSSNAMPASLATVNAVCTRLPWRTPKMLMMEMRMMAPIANPRVPASPMGMK
jgi:hypothetical protein